MVRGALRHLARRVGLQLRRFGERVRRLPHDLRRAAAAAHSRVGRGQGLRRDSRAGDDSTQRLRASAEEAQDVSRYDPTELKRLIELEYERTSKFIDGVIATTATIRGWAVTIWLAVVGVAFDRSVWELGVLAAIVAAVFMVIDA